MDKVSFVVKDKTSFNDDDGIINIFSLLYMYVYFER